MMYDVAGHNEDADVSGSGPEGTIERLKKYTYILPSGRRVMVVLDDEIEPAGTAS